MTQLWTPGTEIRRPARTMTAERMRWYADVLHTLAANSQEPLGAGSNIHTDDAVARANGLPSRVADGMVSTNWLSSALTEAFGEGYLHGGALRTRFLRPIFEDERIEVVIRVSGRRTPEGGEDGRERVDADVACVKADGTVATSGTASAWVLGSGVEGSARGHE
jgi:3-hydroxybutyryl-CoA dehydratase